MAKPTHRHFKNRKDHMGSILYTTQFGSRLFGTSTPSSDMDIKHIELPDIQGLLIGRKISNRVVKTNTAVNTKNGADDIDVEFVPIQQFARDFYEGQTYALEIAFSVDGSHAGQTHMGHDGSPAPMDPNSKFCQFVDELKMKFLTSNIRAMMGYVVNQTNIYSFKGERLNCAKAAKEFISGLDPMATIQDSMHDLDALARAKALAASYPKYFTLEQYEIGAARYAPCFKLLDKTVPWSIKAGSASEIVASSIKKYGQRAKEASIDNVDWKATMHAVRIVDEGISLLSEHQISLPHPPKAATRLLAIRRGEVPLAEIRDELDSKLDRLKSLADVCSLPANTPELTEKFDAWLQAWMMKFYGLSIEPKAALGSSPKI